MSYSIELLQPTFAAIYMAYHSKDIGTALKRRILLADIQRATLMCEAYRNYVSEASTEQAAIESRIIQETLTKFAGMFYNLPEADPLKAELARTIQHLRKTAKAYELDKEGTDLNAFMAGVNSSSRDQPTQEDLDFFDQCAQMPDLRNERI